MTPPAWSDTHCHLDFPEFDFDREKVINQCAAAGCSALVVPGISRAHSLRVLNTCALAPWLYPALGLHPWYVEDHEMADLEVLDTLLPQCVALGEAGLDFARPQWRTDSVRTLQMDLLDAQFELARQHDLPLLLHVRKAEQAMLAIMDRHPGSRGIVHAFTGSLHSAQAFVKRGFLLGIGGAWTSPQATRLQRIWKDLPLEWLVMETDAPAMTPMFKRLPGQVRRNQPDWLPEIAAHLSKARGISTAALLDITHANARRMLQIQSSSGRHGRS